MADIQNYHCCMHGWICMYATALQQHVTPPYPPLACRGTASPLVPNLLDFLPSGGASFWQPYWKTSMRLFLSECPVAASRQSV